MVARLCDKYHNNIIVLARLQFAHTNVFRLFVCFI